METKINTIRDIDMLNIQNLRQFLPTGNIKKIANQLKVSEQTVSRSFSSDLNKRQKVAPITRELIYQEARKIIKDAFKRYHTDVSPAKCCAEQ